ncbi:YqgE/AlgH family protein [Rhizosphaericola mali]|uniref:YqgE/AlgH family protein n=1 Tax=Rhizosphaericola mali TaxID=2545455 RepID=A0A5P2G749_9BACT|nr:YqgE/AlgH family protein [Rhizosphaericola mali]QES89762.1 YqgE/AlgH family protein [Rhizosphaericola mali]
MDHEHLFFIHNQPEIGGDEITDGLYYSGDFKKALNNQIPALNYKMKIFVGYCGWDREQLLDEIKEGDWRVLPSPSLGIIFNDDITTIWNLSVDK